MTWRQILGWLLVLVILSAPLLGAWIRNRDMRRLGGYSDSALANHKAILNEVRDVKRLLQRLAEKFGV